MKKLLVLTLLISLFLNPNFANAAVKAGSSCKKLNQVSNSGGKKYTCIKSGKKLVWNKGESIAKTPVVTVPESWAIDKAAEGNIFSIADQSARKNFNSSASKAEIVLNVGPNTDKIQAEKYMASLFEISKFWKKDWPNNSVVNISIANVNDYEWMRPYWSQYGLTGGGFDASLASWSMAGEYCNHGSAILASEPFLWGCMPTKGDLSNIGTLKFGAHEYTHLAQYGIIRQAGSRANLPVLISEGSADFYGITFSSSPSKINNDWMIFFKSGYMSPDARAYLRTATTDQIETLLINAFNNGTNVNSHWYYTGAYAVIRMVAAKGHDGFVAFMKDFASTGSASSSFEKIYGTTFAAFAKLIAPEIYTLTRTLRAD